VIKTADTLLRPVEDVLFNPSRSVGAKLQPLGESTGRFQLCNVLRRAKNELPQPQFR
jgi:hypothetical protein